MTFIGIGMFSGCRSLEELDLPKSIDRISDQAFMNSGLKKIAIPDNVMYIGDDAFYWCENLTSVTLPEELQTIGQRAFWNCGSLSSLELPDKVTSIGADAFANTGLATLNMPNSVEAIGERLFSGCTKLVSVTLSESLQVLPEAMFDGCALETLTIPEGVVQINNAFSFVTSLKSLYFLSQNPPVGTFNICEETIVYVPKGRVEAYKSQFMWSDFTDRICEME